MIDIITVIIGGYLTFRSIRESDSVLGLLGLGIIAATVLHTL